MLPAGAFDAAEGIDYSHDGALLAVAELRGDCVAIVSGGAIVSRISCLCGPHDVAFSGDDALLFVANRRGNTVTAHPRAGEASYADAPAFRLRRAGWRSTTAVAVDPWGRLAVVDHEPSVSGYGEDGLLRWELRGPSLDIPDGIAFSPAGVLLAVANNGSHSVTVYEGGHGGYGPEPVARIGGLRHPHGLAFVGEDLLVVASSGGPEIVAFKRGGGDWSAVARWPACPYEAFLAVHVDAYLASGRTLACEGGAKGLAIHGHRLAWSGPNIGLRQISLDCLGLIP